MKNESLPVTKEKETKKQMAAKIFGSATLGSGGSNQQRDIAISEPQNPSLENISWSTKESSSCIQDLEGWSHIRTNAFTTKTIDGGSSKE